jgi:transcriptional regulator with XRE-family HTH domain
MDYGQVMLQLRTERLKRGWSLTRVTVLTGIAESDLSKIERGLVFAHPGWQRRLSRAFGLPSSVLFADVALAEARR